MEVVLLLLLAIWGSAASKLNAVIILADDGGFEMGAYGNKFCQTPNLDALAAKSLIFNNAFTSVSSCSPSRSALLTGMPVHQNGMYGLHQAENHFNSFSTIRTLPKILRENNIRSGIIGKKHVGPSETYAFDYEQTEGNNPINQVGRNITNIKFLVRDFLQNQTDTRNFLLYIAFHDPHRCGHTNPEFGEFCQRFGNGEPGMGVIPDWTPIYYQHDQVPIPYFIPNTIEAQKDVAAYYTTISRLDQGVGLIMTELQNAGLLNDTLIIYSSDNGISFPNGRTNFYDSGMKEPMLISSPLHKERQHQITYSLTSLLDIVPTLLDWFGIEDEVSNEINPQTNLTGKSLLPVLIKEPDPTNEAIFGSHVLHEVTMYYPMRVIRTHKYKLIHNLNYQSAFPIDQDGYLSPTFQDILNMTRNGGNVWFKTLKNYYYRPEWELYDLKLDPEELTNVVEKNSYRKIREILTDRLVSWQRQTSDPWICAPHGVFENKGRFKAHPQCLSLDND